MRTLKLGSLGCFWSKCLCRLSQVLLLTVADMVELSMIIGKLSGTAGFEVFL